jgi:transposase
MYIRKTTTRNVSSQKYTTYRLVTSERVNGKVLQKTLLNLGADFNLPEEDWPILISLIESCLMNQYRIEFDSRPEIEELASKYYQQIVINKRNIVFEGTTDVGTTENDWQEVDINSLESVKPRKIGVEHVGVSILEELKLPEILSEKGLNATQVASVMALIVGRMSEPGSELSTLNWLKNESGLGELLGFNYEDFSIMNLYRASDILVKNQDELEKRIFGRINDLFSLQTTVTLYDLTNTYFEGDMDESEVAKRGHSKEKRSDCPIVTLALVLDSSGFVRRSKVFEGNIFEGHTFQGMIAELNVSRSSIIVMDRGIATQENVEWMKENQYQYIVVSRNQHREFNEDKEYTEIETASKEVVKIQRVSESDDGEFKLYCHSELRAEKEDAMAKTQCELYEKELQNLNDGLDKPRRTKTTDHVLEKLGRLKQKYQMISRYYKIAVEKNENFTRVVKISWKKELQSNNRITHPGVYCLRSNVNGMNDSELWKTYIMLTNLESVFRSLKSELGLRPVFHRNDGRIKGHLFISVLAYQVVQIIRYRLSLSDINNSWPGLRRMLNMQVRITTTFNKRNDQVLHVRKSTVPDRNLALIYDALKLNPRPGGIVKLLY